MKWFILFLMVLTTTVFAQEVIPTVDYNDLLSFVFKSIGEMKGASTMVAVGLITQILMKVAQSQIGEFLGKYKLLFVSLMTLVGGVAGLMAISGTTFMTALLSSGTLAALQVLGHQIYKQFIEKKK